MEWVLGWVRAVVRERPWMILEAISGSVGIGTEGSIWWV